MRGNYPTAGRFARPIRLLVAAAVLAAVAGCGDTASTGGGAGAGTPPAGAAGTDGAAGQPAPKAPTKGVGRTPR
jgi:hypothetical protein